MNNMGVTISRSIKKFMTQVQKHIGTGLKEAAEESAMAAILASPVDTGAFVTSWSIAQQSNRGRSRSSKGKPKITASQAMEEAASLIEQDLSNIPDDAKSIYLNNRAPHAGAATKLMQERSGAIFEQYLRKYFQS
jgi:hypothetical protein